MQILDLPVAKREKLGSANSRRYRRAGEIPCVLYGRGKENVMLTTPAEAFGVIQKAHTALVRLTLGDVEQTAMIREVRWDVWGEQVEHIDFVRVEAEDTVLITVPVTYTGVPAGVHAGGSVHIMAADLPLHCRVDSIPNEIEVEISHLEVDDAIHVGEIEYPANVRPARADHELLIHVREPRKTEPLPEELEAAALAESEAAAAAEGEGAPEGEGTEAPASSS
jgi:large subunit ribosomal protein L25